MSTDCGGLGRTLQQTRRLNETSADKRPPPPQRRRRRFAPDLPQSGAIQGGIKQRLPLMESDGAYSSAGAAHLHHLLHLLQWSRDTHTHTHTLHPSGKFSFTTHTHSPWLAVNRPPRCSLSSFYGSVPPPSPTSPQPAPPRSGPPCKGVRKNYD